MAPSPRNQPELRTRFFMLEAPQGTQQWHFRRPPPFQVDQKAQIAFLRSILSHRRCAPFLFGLCFLFSSSSSLYLRTNLRSLPSMDDQARKNETPI